MASAIISLNVMLSSCWRNQWRNGISINGVIYQSISGGWRGNIKLWPAAGGVNNPSLYQ